MSSLRSDVRSWRNLLVELGCRISLRVCMVRAPVHAPVHAPVREPPLRLRLGALVADCSVRARTALCRASSRLAPASDSCGDSAGRADASIAGFALERSDEPGYAFRSVADGPPARSGLLLRELLRQMVGRSL